MATPANEAESRAGSGDEPVVHILWMNGGLGCDGDSVGALTAATQPSIEEIALGALPGLPKIAVHWPLIDYECGPETGADTFIEWWHKADRGELEPFVLVVEGSIPNEAIKSEGYWCGFGNNPATGQPMTTNEWLDRTGAWPPRSSRWAPVATYGGGQDHGNPTGAMGVPDYLGWDWRSKAGLPIVCVPGCPIHPDDLSETHPLPALPGGRAGPDASRWTRRCGRPGCSARPCTRAATGRATPSRATSRASTARPKCLVKLGCWGPVVKCNVPKRGWINGVGGCPNVGGICIACTMPGFRGQVHAVHGRAAGIEGLHDGKHDVRHCDPHPSRLHREDRRREPKWRVKGDELLTGFKKTW